MRQQELRIDDIAQPRVVQYLGTQQLLVAPGVEHSLVFLQQVHDLLERHRVAGRPSAPPGRGEDQIPGSQRYGRITCSAGEVANLDGATECRPLKIEQRMQGRQVVALLARDDADAAIPRLRQRNRQQQRRPRPAHQLFGNDAVDHEHDPGGSAGSWIVRNGRKSPSACCVSVATDCSLVSWRRRFITRTIGRWS
ncbi:hypothetical protein [Sphingomonas aurantiaca]|uniref:hypothetical protein n=1 Tax=Sphingomonas aurantiaca TaxID=185949 RepID=UPI003A5BA61B